MGRKPKNKSEESFLAFHEGTKIKVFEMQVPFVYKFTVIPSDQIGYTEWEYHVKKPEDLPLLKYEIEKKDYTVTKIELATRKLTDLCARCHKRGTPKIEKKDSNDRRTRRPTSSEWSVEIEKNKIHTERPVEYWLTYTHSKLEKCRIRQYTNTPDPSYKKNDIDIEKYFFPYILEHMKNGSIWYADEPLHISQ